MVTLTARESWRTDRRFRSGVCALATVAVVLAVLLAAVIKTDSPAMSRENDDVIAEAAHYLEGLGTDETESRHQQPKSVRVGQTMSSSSTSIRRGVSRTRMVLEADIVLEADVTESGQACETNPLYARHLDPVKYKFGSREIEVCNLKGQFTPKWAKTRLACSCSFWAKESWRSIYLVTRVVVPLLIFLEPSTGRP